MKLYRYWLVLLGVILAAQCATVHASEMAALAAQKDLTPATLLRSFAGFAFELGAKPQDPEVFLQRRRGDCDDFAQLASQLLSGLGYHAKLVVVMMEKETHVVCYVREAQGFLDFNRRAEPHPVAGSDGSLEDIAQKVAASFHSNWRMASEFRYENKLPRYLASVFPSSPTLEPAVAAVRPRKNN
jgi:hypothetical protein